ncbi:MAG: TIGR03915 family putative DNA repair protein [Trichlorobacter sp.]|uniref:TIGR03915 family putative DNA repair protein n=1 Tax=Trichlorobacter sp. TaxID=2911007 RepID=UPI0025610DA9|nr:TIGR03915 family putative DNA repair protein [Trichlorobacter sp.]MDK9716886.1 TIGR03915 family putative DNA repair protein [Trichlorobacter sp.]
MSGCYCYDGTLAGLLTLYPHLLAERAAVERISAAPPDQQSLFNSEICIATDQAVAEVFWQHLTRRLSPHSLKLLRRCLLADHPQQELLIYHYLLLEAEQGRRVDGMLAHPQVAPVWKLAQQVAREAHRYLGFVRFQQIQGGLYYAAIRPDHRILLLIGTHFAERFSDQQWLIHDQRHGEGILYDAEKQEWLLLPMEVTAQPDLAPEEAQFQELWRSYFSTLAIPERTNLRLQQGKVPLKTRSCLTEFTV